VTQPPDDPYATPQPGGLPQYPPPAPGDAQFGQPQYGQPQYGQQPYAQAPYGQAPYGYARGQLANWPRRVGGRLLDGIIFGVPASIIGVASGSVGVRYLMDLLVIVIIGYLNGARGQTPGKRIVGIRLQRDTDGQVLGAGMGIAREFAHFVDTFALFLGWLWPLWDGKRQTFADKIVGSVAIVA